MPGPYRERIYGVAVKIETTSGTDAVPDPAVNAVQPVGGIPYLTVDYLEPGTRDDVITGLLIDADRTTAAGRFGKLSLTVEVKGSGAAGTAPDVDALLRMSGFGKTVSAGVSVRYSTLDIGMETASVYCWTLGQLFKLVGASATMKLSADAAKRGLMTFDITGRMVSDSVDAALPGTLATSTVLPPGFHSAVATIGAWTSGDADPLIVKSAAIDLQNTITDRPSAGATDGLIGYSITDRKAQQTMTIEVVALATFDPFTLSKSAGTSQPTSSWQIGTAAGNRLKVLTGKWSLKAPAPGANKSLVTYGLTGSLGAGASGATTRELSLLYD